MLSETHTAHRDMLIRDIIARMRHNGCGGRAEKVELMIGIDGASRPVRKVVLRAKQQARPLGMAQGGMASEKYRAAN